MSNSLTATVSQGSSRLASSHLWRVQCAKHLPMIHQVFARLAGLLPFEQAVEFLELDVGLDASRMVAWYCGVIIQPIQCHLIIAVGRQLRLKQIYLDGMIFPDLFARAFDV